MITVTILINGQPIYTRSAVNKSYPNTPAKEIHTYEVDDGSIIRHRRWHGAVVLAKKMLDTIKESK